MNFSSRCSIFMNRKTSYFLLINTILMLSMLFFIPAQPRTVSTQSSSYQLVYIYNTDLSVANSFKSQISTWGWSVELVNSSNLDNGNWSSYQLIILGYDTGYHYTWSNSTQVSYLNNLNRSFLATGQGSLSFYSELHLADEWGSNAGGSGINVTAYNQTYPSPIFNNPNTVNTVNTSLFTTAAAWQGYYIGGSINSTVNVIGYDSVATNYAPIAVQYSRYGVWGYDGSPTIWTTEGKSLFQNFIVYLTGSNPLTASNSSSSSSTTTTSSTIPAPVNL